MSGLLEDTIDACQQCRRYISREQTGLNQFNVAWAAVLWTYFSNSGKPARVVDEMVRLLPPVLYMQWKPSIAQMSSCARSAFEKFGNEFETSDGTFLWELFVDLEENPRQTMKEGRWENILNTFPFPTIRCPAGCHVYVDEKVECISLKHYIRKIDPEFSNFKADDRFLAGARPDWPRSAVSSCGIIVKPTILRDDVNGLSFFACHPTVHPLFNTEYIHVPKNPVLSMPLDKPYPFSSLFVSSNIVRKEKQHSFNTSFRVVKQVGTSAGLSTFCLSSKIDEHPKCSTDVIDMTNLLLDERRDFQIHMNSTRAWEAVDSFRQFRKSTEIWKSLVRSCKVSGTYVDRSDAIHHTQALLFNRTEIQSDEMENSQDSVNLNVTDRIEDCIHVIRNVLLPENKTKDVTHKYYGFPNWNRGGYTNGMKTYLTCSILMNSRCLHRNFMEKGCWGRSSLPIDIQRSIDRIQNLLKRSKKGGNLRTKYTYADVAVAEKNIRCHDRIPVQRDEILAEKEGLHQTVAQYLSNNCTFTIHLNDIPATSFADFNLEHGDVENIIVTTMHLSRHSFRSIPNSILEQKYSIRFAGRISRTSHGGSDTFHCQHLVRWSEDDAWCRFEDGVSVPPFNFIDSNNSLKGSYNFLLYSTNLDQRPLLEYERINLTGGQNIVWCDFHQSAPLVREGPSPKDWKSCCVRGCNLHGIFRCQWNISARRCQCSTAVCRKHYLEAVKNDQKVYLKPNPTMRLPSTIPISSNLSDASSESSDLSSLSDISVNSVNARNLDLVNNMTYVEDPTMEMADNQSKELQPAFEPWIPGSNRVQSCYLLNNLYQVMTRQRRGRGCPLNLQRLLQSVFSSDPHGAVSTLFFEAQLFPTIFPFEENGSVVGAMPQSMFVHPNLHKNSRGIGSLIQHMRIRMKDYAILTSSDPDYITFAFDVVMNYMANFNVIPLAIKKGPEFLRRGSDYDGIEIKHYDGRMQFDVMESRGPVNELSAFVRDVGQWHYFITITCNDQRTPGVCRINQYLDTYIRHLENSKGFNQMNDSPSCTRMRVLTAAQPVILRAWVRYVKFFWKWVAHGPDEPLGPVKEVWFR